MLEQGLITFTGDDVAEFLQGQLTCDVKEISPDQIHLGAYCNPQGRVISTFRIFLRENQFHLELPKDNIDITQQTLHKYAVFSKISVLSEPSKNSLDLVSQIKKGIPNITATTSEKFTPHMLNLPELGAVSFNKGCFIGQEVVARTEHLGTVKRKLYKVNIDSNQTPKPGDKLIDENQHEVGIVVNASQRQLLAVIKVAAIDTTIFWQNFVCRPIAPLC